MNAITGEPFESEGGGGGADLSAGGTIAVGGPTNAEDAAFQHQVGTDIWSVGIDATDTAGLRPYKIARGADISLNDYLQVSSTGTVDAASHVNVAGLLKVGTAAVNPTVGLDQGQLYANTGDNTLRFFDGTNWLTITTAALLPPTVTVTGGGQTLQARDRSTTFTATLNNYPAGVATYTWTSTDGGAFFSAQGTASTDVEFSAVGVFTVSCQAVVGVTNQLGVSTNNTINASDTVLGLFDQGLQTQIGGYNAANIGAIFSLRRTRVAAAGDFCCQIQKPGGALTNIAWDNDGYVSRTQVDAATGTGAAAVQIWYDQSNNGRNASASLTDRPTLSFGAGPNFIPQISFTPPGLGQTYLQLVGTSTLNMKLHGTIHESTIMAVSDVDVFVSDKSVFGTGTTYAIETQSDPALRFSTDEPGGIAPTAETFNFDMTTVTPFVVSCGLNGVDRFASFNNVLTTNVGSGTGNLQVTPTVGNVLIGNTTFTNTDTWTGSIFEVFTTDFNMVGGDRGKLNTRKGTHFQARASFPDLPALAPLVLTLIAPAVPSTSFVSTTGPPPGTNTGLIAGQTEQANFADTNFDWWNQIGGSVLNNINDGGVTGIVGATCTNVYTGGGLGNYNGVLATSTNYIPVGGGPAVAVSGAYIEFSLPPTAVGGFDMYFRPDTNVRDVSQWVLLFSNTVQGDVLNTRVWTAVDAGCVQLVPNPAPPPIAATRRVRVDFGANTVTNNWVAMRLVVNRCFVNAQIPSILELDALRYQ